MPPKKQAPGPSNKVKDDKTFGMKNKNKSSKVQKQVAQIQAQQAVAGKSRSVIEKEREKELRAKQKADEEKRKKEEAAMFKPVLGIVEKKNLYEDNREDKATDTMDQWDEEKLRRVVLSKHGNPRTSTDIVCKFFIEAIETQKFGWFWECPNGSNCQYRHALPPGFVLKSQKKALDEAAKANTISLEEFLEVERHKLGTNLTPVTPESFAVWKKTRMDKKEAEQEALRKAKDLHSSAGKSSGMSGRDLFQYNPEWFEDEDEAGSDDDWDLTQYRKQKEDEDMEAEALRIANLSLQGDSQNHAGGWPGIQDQ
ncbi:hypothetical protein Agabi119p4_5959 [Agaricus bisporus var. burnettii]|uniref:C3H1-type domain-containing protein n=1 Tax=Agaricus bisporus var. burnettii TaxID=192524 RepID=A0A8H7F0W1_AGABI|nr:hypothetical protein Agabi119p4_5959 [Agaricus bisporus var. burnettii]